MTTWLRRLQTSEVEEAACMKAQEWLRGLPKRFPRMSEVDAVLLAHREAATGRFLHVVLDHMPPTCYFSQQASLLHAILGRMRSVGEDGEFLPAMRTFLHSLGAAYPTALLSVVAWSYVFREAALIGDDSVISNNLGEFHDVLSKVPERAQEFSAYAMCSASIALRPRIHTSRTYIAHAADAVRRWYLDAKAHDASELEWRLLRRDLQTIEVEWKSVDTESLPFFDQDVIAEIEERAGLVAR